MLEVLKFLGFTLLALRYFYWIGSSFERIQTYTLRVFVGQLIEGILLLFFFQQLFGKEHILLFQPTLSTQLIGFLLVVIGVGIAFLAKQQLGDEWVYASAYIQQKAKRLITTGAYSIVRHPIYTGILVSYLGAELLAGSWIWISMLFFLIPFYVQARKEEKLLLQHFGQKYKKYQSQTKMLIPFIF